MKFININSDKFMKIDLPSNCSHDDKGFIDKLSDFIQYQYNEYIDELKLFTKKKVVFKKFLADLNGLDTILHILDYLTSELNSIKFQTFPILRKMVRAGKLGCKTGEGFYEY